MLATVTQVKLPSNRIVAVVNAQVPSTQAQRARIPSSETLFVERDASKPILPQSNFSPPVECSILGDPNAISVVAKSWHRLINRIVAIANPNFEPLFSLYGSAVGILPVPFKREGLLRSRRKALPNDISGHFVSIVKLAAHDLDFQVNGLEARWNDGTTQRNLKSSRGFSAWYPVTRVVQAERCSGQGNVLPENLILAFNNRTINEVCAVCLIVA